MPNLAGSQDDGGELGAVAPLGEEGEGERLDEDGRDDAVPPGRRRRQRGAGPRLNIRHAIGHFGTLQLSKNQ